MLEEKRVLITDTSMRDAHQSLLATRFRTLDMAVIAPLLRAPAAAAVLGRMLGRSYVRRRHAIPQGRSLGAARRFREAMPNLLLQMLLRSANAVGYANYPDNVVRYFVEQAAAGGIDVFRVFDCLNWVDEHAGGHRGGAGSGKAVRGGDLLHRQPLESAGEQVRPRVLPRIAAS